MGKGEPLLLKGCYTKIKPFQLGLGSLLSLVDHGVLA